MKALGKIGTVLIALVALGIAGAPLLLAHTPAEQAPAPREKVAPAFNEQVPNAPGKSLVGIVVSYPPGGTTPAHIHARSAFVTGYVLSGAIRSQVDGGETKVFKTGESWSEQPGAHHGVSENASATEPASLLAIFLVDTDDTELTTIVGR